MQSEKNLIQTIMQERVKFYYYDEKGVLRHLKVPPGSKESKEPMSREEQEIEHFERTGEVSINTLLRNFDLFHMLEVKLFNGELDNNEELKYKVLDALFKMIDYEEP